MQRFIGMLLAIAGAAIVLFGGYYVMTGRSDIRVEVTPDFSVSALVGALGGVAVFTLGLIWMRD